VNLSWTERERKTMNERQSFRAQFAPVIARVILANQGKSMVEITQALREAWRHNVKTDANAYMQSAWSKEVSRQLASHLDNQRPIEELPLFKQNG